MEKIELKAYGKINLGLDVIRKRPDGYHDLDMIMQMVDVYDDIVITKNKTGKIEVKTDTAVLSNGKDNLAYMAAKMLMDEFKIKDGVNIYINKRIPIAGGMAGVDGSGREAWSRCSLLCFRWNSHSKRHWRGFNTTSCTS